MKRATILNKSLLLVMILLLAITVSTVFAASPLSIPSYWMEDPINPGLPAPAEGTDPNSAVDGYWWRDTTNQNAIADQYDSDYYVQVLHPYTSGTLNIWVYNANTNPANVVILEGTESLLLIGTGGSTNGASAAKAALWKARPKLSTKPIIGIVSRSTMPEDIDGAYPVWAPQNTTIPIYGEVSFKDVLLEKYPFKTESHLLRDRLLGNGLTDGTNGSLNWFTAENILQPFFLPKSLISAPENIDLDGLKITLIPVTDGSLSVWTGYLPEQPQILITCSPLAKHFPDLYPIGGKSWRPDAYVKFINSLKQIPPAWLEPAADSTARGVPPHSLPVQPDLLIPSRTLPITGEAEIQSALSDQANAVQYVYTETVNLINQDVPVEDAVAQINSQWQGLALANQPSARDISSSIGATVRGIYHDLKGVFGGNPLELTSTLSTTAQAQVMTDLAGGLDNLIAASRSAELNARDQASAEKALMLAQAAYQATPAGSDLLYTTRRIYAQALRKNAYMQRSDQVRNYFLSLAQDIEPVNNAPVVSNSIADGTAAEDVDHTAIDLTGVFMDPDGDTLTYTAQNSNPNLIGATVSGANLVLDYQENQNGAATITVTATDPAGASVSDDFTVTVNPVNDAPTSADVEITVVAGKSQTITLDYGDLETAQADLTVAFGSLYGTLDASALPNLTYTAPATSGDESFTYTVTDRGDPDGCTAAPCAALASATATIHVTVLAAPSGSISGKVFNDANADGILDAGESGLAGISVQLQDVNGTQLETITTAADGLYTFSELDAGSYQVYAPKDANRVQTTQNPFAVTLVEAQAATGVNIGSVVSADLKVTMTASVNSKAIIYAITITNNGPADAIGASLTDALPGTVSYISVISTQGTCSGGKTVTCSFGTIARGSSVTVTLKVNRVNTKIAVVNTAIATSSIFDIVPGNNSATMTTP